MEDSRNEWSDHVIAALSKWDLAEARRLCKEQPDQDLSYVGFSILFTQVDRLWSKIQELEEENRVMVEMLEKVGTIIDLIIPDPKQKTE